MENEACLTNPSVDGEGADHIKAQVDDREGERLVKMSGLFQGGYGEGRNRRIIRKMAIQRNTSKNPVFAQMIKRDNLSIHPHLPLSKIPP